jgi:hypothetical protein
MTNTTDDSTQPSAARVVLAILAATRTPLTTRQIYDQSTEFTSTTQISAAVFELRKRGRVQTETRADGRYHSLADGAPRAAPPEPMPAKPAAVPPARPAAPAQRTPGPQPSRPATAPTAPPVAPPPATRAVQVGGDHYARHGIQPWDVIAEYRLDYFLGNVLKYLLRHEDKGGLEDLRKARHYLDHAIALREPPG